MAGRQWLRATLLVLVAFLTLELQQYRLCQLRSWWMVSNQASFN